MGAPRKNPPKDARVETERLAAQGYSIVGIAKHFGVSRPTLQRWMEEDESLRKHSKWEKKRSVKPCIR